MKTLYQLVEDKPTISQQATEIKNQRQKIKNMLDILDVNYTESNITLIRSLLNEEYGIEELKQVYYLVR